MFSLIITVVSIALVVALVAATLYHGDGADKGKDQAKAAGLMAQAQQIESARIAYSANTGAAVANLDDLVPSYLRSLPAGWAAVEGFVVSTPENKISDDACRAFNAKQQIEGIPSCSDAAYADKQLCCRADPL